MKKLFECVKIDILLNIRNGLILMMTLFTFFLCWFQFFYIMPRENVIGNAMTLSSWATQIFIIEGTVFGFVLAISESRNIQELFYTLDGCLYLKRLSKIIVSGIMSLLLACICSINCVLGLYRLGAADIYNSESIKYLLLYWILPFLIASIGAEMIADLVRGKIKYALLALQMLLLGPLLPKLLEPLIDVTTNLYKYAAMFSVGTLNTSKPMNLMFGYDLQYDKIFASLLILSSFSIFFLGSPRNKTFQKALRIMSIVIFICGICLNAQYIQGKYDYYVAMEEYEAYQSGVDAKSGNGLAYQISSESISIDNGNPLAMSAELSICTNAESDFITFALYRNFEIDDIKINGSSIGYQRNVDIVTLPFSFAANTNYQIEVTYHGKPPAHMYISSKEWILPSYVAWYPMKGEKNSISYEQDLMDLNFYNYKQDCMIFQIKYEGSETVYCSLNEQSSHVWQGETNAVTLLCSKWMNQFTTDSGITVIYPMSCTNYDKYLETYIEEYMDVCDVINEIAGNGEENATDICSIFFTCDSTYTGHGEKIYPASDHAVIEITRAYIDGDFLCNPNLTVYPLLEAVLFDDADCPIDTDDLYLYKTAFITTAVHAGELNDSYLLRTLDDLKSMYENLEGYTDFYHIICTVQQYLDKATEEEQYQFLADFKDLLKSGDALTENSVERITEALR